MLEYSPTMGLQQLDVSTPFPPPCSYWWVYSQWHLVWRWFLPILWRSLALVYCWTNYFNNELRDITSELWEKYHFVGNTGRITVFTAKPYSEAFSTLRINYTGFPEYTKDKTDYEPLMYAGFVICLTGTMSTAMRMILQPLILMMDIPLDMRQIDSPEGSGYYSKSAPATILNSIRIIYSTLIRKSKGTGYCSRNSKNFYYSQQSWQITVAVGGNSFHPQ